MHPKRVWTEDHIGRPRIFDDVLGISFHTVTTLYRFGENNEESDFFIEFEVKKSPRYAAGYPYRDIRLSSTYRTQRGELSYSNAQLLRA